MNNKLSTQARAVRMPTELWMLIRKAAAKNTRPIASEIVHRLRESFKK